jgi:hypothetical protein
LQRRTEKKFKKKQKHSAFFTKSSGKVVHFSYMSEQKNEADRVIRLVFSSKLFYERKSIFSVRIKQRPVPSLPRQP